ncbi:MAG: 3'-5' exonuclease [Myxococcota bacterium]
MSYLLDERIAEATYVVVDLETTGVVVGRDEIVEIAAVVFTPREAPAVALNTLVKPSRSVRGTDIHGIANADVADAPAFHELRSALEAVLANRVIAAHNASFDLRFLSFALWPDSPDRSLPHVCTMGLHTLLGLGAQFPLHHACGHFGIEAGDRHAALDDAMATARLLRILLQRLEGIGIGTFRELISRASERAFSKSLHAEPMAAPQHMLTEASVRQRPRNAPPPEKSSRAREYLNTVLQVVADLEIADAELGRVAARRAELQIGDDEMRAIHARVMAAMITRYSEDRRIDEVERLQLRRLYQCLDRLGWAPGT